MGKPKGPKRSLTKALKRIPVWSRENGGGKPAARAPESVPPAASADGATPVLPGAMLPAPLVARSRPLLAACIEDLTAENSVGSVQVMDYDTATLAVNDFHREMAGGLARGRFLVAGMPPKNGRADLVLLRVMGAAHLANHEEINRTRLTATQESMGEHAWTERLDPHLRSEASTGGVLCNVLGSLTLEGNGAVRYAQGVPNYYSARGEFAWKPQGRLLDRIVNLQHGSPSFDVSGLFDGEPPSFLMPLGEARFAAARREGQARTAVYINPLALIARRTAFFGMSRSGKSNTMKVIARGVYLLRALNDRLRIGQFIIDPNGEYAQDNDQDGPGLHRVHMEIGLPRAKEVVTYGAYETKRDKHRKLTKTNFFGNPIPANRRNDYATVRNAVDQLVVGHELIKDEMFKESTRFTKNFRDTDLSAPSDIGDRSVATRYHRALVVYKTALQAAGFDAPGTGADIAGLFGKGLRKALAAPENSRSDNAIRYRRAAKVFGQRQASWDQLQDAFKSLNLFITDSKSTYEAFNHDYMAKHSSSGEAWAGGRLQCLLGIFLTHNGVLSFQKLRSRHSLGPESDYADDIVRDLGEGKLVILDQSVGSERENRATAVRIMSKLFAKQQQAFTSGPESNPWEGQVLVYAEEAHNLLPRNETDKAGRIWRRTAKEGGKMKLGLVFATQAPSSMSPDILSETDNWVIAHLASDGEMKVVEGYHDFRDFRHQIRYVSEPGFVRLRTLSSAYTVPIQVDRFCIEAGRGGR